MRREYQQRRHRKDSQAPWQTRMYLTRRPRSIRIEHANSPYVIGKTTEAGAVPVTRDRPGITRSSEPGIGAAQRCNSGATARPFQFANRLLKDQRKSDRAGLLVVGSVSSTFDVGFIFCRPDVPTVAVLSPARNNRKPSRDAEGGCVPTRSAEKIWLQRPLSRRWRLNDCKLVEPTRAKRRGQR